MTIEYLGNIRGPQGYSVSEAAIGPADDHLRLRLSNGQVLDAGSARGPQGLPGASGETTDAAVAGLIGTTSQTKSALDAGYRPTLLASAYGVVGDGVADDWSALQALLDNAASIGASVMLAPGTVVAVQSTLLIPSRTRLDLNGSTIKNACPGVADRPILISGVSDVLISNGVIDGDKANFATATEQRHNFHINNSSRVTLRNIVSKAAKGDGVYVGDNIAGLSVDVVLDRVTCDGNHRNGLSVTAVDGLVGIGCRFVNTSGTAPQTGMDVEPNTDATMVRGIRMIACEFSGNTMDGLAVALRATATAQQDGGDYVACTIAGNTRHGVYLNNGSRVRFEGGTISRNGGNGIWGSSATSGVASDVRVIGTRIAGNGAQGILVQQPFKRWAVIGAAVADNVGIGMDFSPVGTYGPSDGLTIAATFSGADAKTTQTHGIRTGINVINATTVGNTLTGNTTAAMSSSDDAATRFQLNQATKPTVVGSRAGNAALASMLTGLAARGLIVDTTTA